MKVLAANASTPRTGHVPQRALLRSWLSRFALAGTFLAACVWGWAGYQGSGAQAAITGLWSLCGGAR